MCGIVVAITIYNEQTIKIVNMQLKKIIASALEAGMTQQQIGELVGCTQATIGKIVNGDTEDPRWSTVYGLLRLAADKGINVDWGGMGLHPKSEVSEETDSPGSHVQQQESDQPLLKELRAIHATLKDRLGSGRPPYFRLGTPCIGPSSPSPAGRKAINAPDDSQSQQPEGQGISHG